MAWKSAMFPPTIFAVQPKFMKMKLGQSCFLLAAAFVSVVTSAEAQSWWNQPAGGSWNVAQNWFQVQPNGTGASAIFNNAAGPFNPAQTGNRTVTVDAPQVIGSITFNNDGANSFTMSLTTGANGTLAFDETGSGPANIFVPAWAGTGNNSISAPIFLADSLLATVNHTNSSSAAGALNLTAGISGPGGFTKQGDGLATLGTGAKLYTGPTILSGGRMRISLAAHPTATSGLTINSNAQLTLISAGSYAFGSNAIHLNGAGATTGPFAAFPGAIRPDTSLVIGISNAVVLDSDTVIHVQGTSGSIAFSNTISGPGKLTLTAPSHDANLGSLNIVSNNTYSGGTVVHGGTIVLGGSFTHGTASSLGSGNVTVESANSTFAGATARLQIQSGVLDGIANTGTLSLAGGKMPGVADDGYIILEAFVNETVAGLFLGGVSQPYGAYGSTTSGATYQYDEYFSGPGILTVAPPPPTLTIVRSVPNIIVSWPTNDTGFTLQQTPALSSTTNVWTNVTNSVVVMGTNNAVTFASPSSNSFFRLVK
jgi:autotransporter-associated beta strand protein